MIKAGWNESESLAGLQVGAIQKTLGVEFRGPDQEAPVCHSLVQVHGTLVLEASEKTRHDSAHLPEADGLYTTQRGVCLGIKTADCLPVILASAHDPWLSVLHAGWRGLLSGILHAAVRNFRSLGGDPRNLVMVTGPCISLSCFEVGGDLVTALESTCLTAQERSECLRPGRGDRWHMDLSAVAAFQALHEDLRTDAVHLLRSCTYQNPRLWNSYRRTGRASPSNWTCASLL